jgi:hypothetical protein
MGVVWHGMVGSVTLGTREVKDPLLGLVLGGLGFEGDGAVGVEELVGDVGEDGSAAGGDAPFGDEDEEAGEELADVGAGGEFGEFGEEFGGEIGEVALVLLDGGSECGDGVVVGVAETKMGSGAVFPAAFTVGETMMTAAASRCSRAGRDRSAWSGGLSCCNCFNINGGTGIRWNGVHEFLVEGVHPPHQNGLSSKQKSCEKSIL